VLHAFREIFLFDNIQKCHIHSSKNTRLKKLVTAHVLLLHCCCCCIICGLLPLLLLFAVDAECWRSAGGESYCANQEFPSKLAERWLEVLSKPGGRIAQKTSMQRTQEHQHHKQEVWLLHVTDD
jgi:hypothetical protein